MKILTTASVIAITAMPALAGGMNEPVMTEQPMVQAAPIVLSGDWTGGYVGGQLGYGNVDADGIDGDGAFGGLHAGYQSDMGTFVVGGEVDYDWTDIELDGGAGSIDNVGRIKLRGGYDMGNTLLYATAGAAYAEAEIGGTNYSDWGWLAGVGVDYKVSDAVSVGGELLYHQFDDFDNTGTDIDATTLAARVSYHF